MQGMNLGDVVVAVSSALEEAGIRHALTGGLAVASWAPAEEVYETHDADFSILSERKDPVAAILKRVPHSRADEDRAVDLIRARIYKAVVSDIHVDFVLPANAAYVRTAFTRNGILRAGVADIPILSPEDVFLFKSLAARPKDVNALWALSRRKDFDWMYVKRWAGKLGTAGALRELRLL
jgi:hypothetical protein